MGLVEKIFQWGMGVAERVYSSVRSYVILMGSEQEQLPPYDFPLDWDFEAEDIQDELYVGMQEAAAELQHGGRRMSDLDSLVNKPSLYSPMYPRAANRPFCEYEEEGIASLRMALAALYSGEAAKTMEGTVYTYNPPTELGTQTEHQGQAKWQEGKWGPNKDMRSDSDKRNFGFER